MSAGSQIFSDYMLTYTRQHQYKKHINTAFNVGDRMNQNHPVMLLQWKTTIKAGNDVILILINAKYQKIWISPDMLCHPGLFNINSDICSDIFITVTFKMSYSFSLHTKTLVLFHFNLTSLWLGWAFESHSPFERSHLRRANRHPALQLLSKNNQAVNRNVKMEIAPQTLPQHGQWGAEWVRWDANTILSFALPTLACAAIAAHVGLSLSDKSLTFTISASL